jgi:alkanesulfonate monooxygenase SsuD/methylene tetrahydromethanopterin reductase-like flavin-dependent oxidoreductase (luciferase family)
MRPGLQPASLEKPTTGGLLVPFSNRSAPDHRSVPGLCLPHRACSAADALRIALLAEELGYESVWVSELATYDAIALASAIAVRTERIRIGTAIVPVSTRTPALHAMSLSTLGWLAPGRSTVGFGISTEPIIAGWHGQPGVVERAVTLTRALFDALDVMLAGERTAGGFRLEAPSPRPPKRYVGALGPRMRALTRKRADGLILNFAPRSALAAIAADEPGDVVLPIRIAIGADLADAQRRFRREAASYLRVQPYCEAIAGHGYPDVVPPGELQDMADALPAEFVDDMAVFGDRARAQRLLAEVAADGVEPLLVPVVAPGDVAGFERVMREAVT